MKISLAIDNCFAMKRWTRPREWMAIARELGLSCVEASADNEIDPLYSTAEHLRAWNDEVAAGTRESGVRVVNLYSGHGTYCTLGLAHDEPTVRQHIKRDWMLAMMRQAAAMGAGLGCYVHAFSEATLNDPAAYANVYRYLIQDLRDLAAHALELGMGPFGIEQMYSPHQIPWTLDGTRDFLTRAVEDSGAPLYVTLDTGHQIGQQRFVRPTAERLHEFHAAARRGQRLPLHLGTRQHYLAFWDLARGGGSREDFVAEVERFCDAHGYLFSAPGDGDPYRWLEQFGCYSPIIHLQQTDGNQSGHKSFTAANNGTGIIHPQPLLQALARSCARPGVAGLPPVDHVYLTLEIFLPTACDSRLAVDEIAESVDYWRQAIPSDGVELDELLERLNVGSHA